MTTLARCAWTLCLWASLAVAQPMPLGEAYPDYILLTQHFAVEADGITWTLDESSLHRRRIVDDFWRRVTDIGTHTMFFATTENPLLLPVQGLDAPQGIHLKRVDAIDRSILCAGDAPLAAPARRMLEALGCHVMTLKDLEEMP